MQPVHCCHVATRGVVHVRVGDDVADREPASGPQHPGGLPEYRGLVPGEVDHAVGDQHVDRVVRQRDVLDRSLQELDVLDPSLALVARARARASRRSCRGHTPCRPGRRAWPRAGRRSRRPSRGRARSRPRAARRPRSGCRSRARRVSRRRERVALRDLVEAVAEHLALLAGDPAHPRRNRRRHRASGASDDI